MSMSDQEKKQIWIDVYKTALVAFAGKYTLEEIAYVKVDEQTSKFDLSQAGDVLIDCDQVAVIAADTALESIRERYDLRALREEQRATG